MPSVTKNGNSFTNVGSGIAWSNPSNAQTSNNVYATCSLAGGENTQYLLVTNFQFNIPSNALIIGIEVRIERRGSDSHVRDHSIKLYDGSSFIGNDKASLTNYPTSDAYATYGGSDDTWGASLSVSLVNSSGFGVGFSSYNASALVRTVYCDHIEMTVYYSPLHTLTLDEVIGITDAARRATSKNYIESLTLTETIAKHLNKGLTDALSLTDLIDLFKLRILDLSLEQISVLDSITKRLNRRLTETVSLSDQIGAILFTSNKPLKMYQPEYLIKVGLQGVTKRFAQKDLYIDE